MSNKYIGIKLPDKKSKGNFGKIFTKNQKGLYVCPTSTLMFTEEQIQHDFKNGYLKEYKDEQ